MSLYGLINRGLGPMGSFPFGLVATAIGAPWTVTVCGLLTISLVSYVALYRSQLRRAEPAGDAGQS
jgi:membrane protein implicated in regulation of membrane protease activity